MCDTLAALTPFTATGGVLFAKNSDRERNEAQGLEMHAAAEHPAGPCCRPPISPFPKGGAPMRCC